MSTFTIGQAADRSGFSPSALRYYEGIGLVTPSRTPSGYRVYDDHTLGRLRFINRAKHLGCSLDEITDLVALWDGERCGPVQGRFHDLVTAKIAEAQAQIRELTALSSQLQAAAGQLAGPATDGPCDDGCACITGTAPAVNSSAVSVALGAKPDVPIACTLDRKAMGDRVADWQAVLAQATFRSRTPDGRLRIDFGTGVQLGQRCCHSGHLETRLATSRWRTGLVGRGRQLTSRRRNTAALTARAVAR